MKKTCEDEPLAGMKYFKAITENYKCVLSLLLRYQRSFKGVQIASKIAFVTRGENALPANLWPTLNLACGRLETSNPRHESASAGVQTLASLGWTTRPWKPSGLNCVVKDEAGLSGLRRLKIS